jgi:hypothetical protein
MWAPFTADDCGRLLCTDSFTHDTAMETGPLCSTTPPLCYGEFVDCHRLPVKMLEEGIWFIQARANV